MRLRPGMLLALHTSLGLKSPGIIVSVDKRRVTVLWQQRLDADDFWVSDYSAKNVSGVIEDGGWAVICE